MLLRRFWLYVAQKVRPFFDIDMNGKKISGLPTTNYPTEDSEVPSKKYVDNKIDGDMLKSTYDVGENDIIDNAEKLEGNSKAEVQDHPVKDHALSAHSDPTDDVNMGGKKITTLADPIADQDIVTKKYVDDLFGKLTPASIPLIYNINPGSDEATIRSKFSTLLALGINTIEGGWGNWGTDQWKNGAGIEVIIDRVYNIAAEMGIKVSWYTSVHRLPWINPDTGETFVGRYKNFPACVSWNYCDEPALMHLPHFDYQDDEGNWQWGCKSAIDFIHSEDPNHPAIPDWSADLETDHYMLTMHPAWGDLYDVSETNIFPHARGGEDWETFLAYRSQLTYRYTGSSPYWGFEHWQPRDHIAMIQAFEEGSPIDIIGQYNILKDGKEGHDWNGWGDRLQGIYFFDAPIFASGDFADDMREQIKALARLLGWSG